MRAWWCGVAMLALLPGCSSSLRSAKTPSPTNSVAQRASADDAPVRAKAAPLVRVVGRAEPAADASRSIVQVAHETNTPASATESPPADPPEPPRQRAVVRVARQDKVPQAAGEPEKKPADQPAPMPDPTTEKPPASEKTPAAAGGTPADAASPATIEPIPFIPHDGLWGAIGPRLSVEYFTGPGFGYYTGYTTFDGFIPVLGSSLNHLVYVDLRGIVSDSNALWGNNVGIGYRFYHPPLDRIFGAWTSWDLRDTQAATYNQVSAGVETIGRYLDFRNNTYIVVGQQTAQTGRFLVAQPFFQGNNVMLPVLVKFDTALSGTDLELGGPLPYLGRYGLRAYGGGYVYHGDNIGTFGGAQGRLVARLSNNVDMNLTVRDDQMFGTTVVFGGALRWGGVRRSLRDPNADSVYNRIADPVQRNYNISVLDPWTVESQAATDPNTGQPVRVVHVDNHAAAGGNGSVEKPLNTLAPAPGVAGNYGIILVNRGDGASTGYNTGVTLATGQRLLGNSMAYTFATREFGMMPLPNKPSGVPVLTGGNGAAVVLASGVEVAGLRIVGGGIIGNGVHGFNINNLTIENSGIAIANASGIGSILNTTVTGASGDGVAIGTAGTGSLILALAGNSVSGNGGNGLALTSLDGSAMTVDIQGGSFNNNTGNGINLVSNNSATMDVTITGGDKSGNAGGVIAQQMGASTLTLTTINDPISGNSGPGMSLSSSGTGTLNANISGSTVADNTGTGITASSADSSTLNLALSNNSINNNAGGGVAVSAAGQSNVNFTMTGNSLAGNGTSTHGHGIHVESSSTGTVTAQIRGNQIQGSGLSGINFDIANGTFRGTVEQNTVRGSGGDGIGVTAMGGTSDLTIHGNTVANNAGTGIALTRTSVPGGGEEESASDPALSASISNNSVAGSGRQGIYVADVAVFSERSTPLNVSVANNQTAGNQGAGIMLTSLSVFGSSNVVARVTGNTLDGDNVGGMDAGGFQATSQGIMGTSNLGLLLRDNTASPANGSGYRLANFGGSFLFEDGGSNGGTLTKVGTITPGVLP